MESIIVVIFILIIFKILKRDTPEKSDLLKLPIAYGNLKAKSSDERRSYFEKVFKVRGIEFLLFDGYSFYDRESNSICNYFDVCRISLLNHEKNLECPSPLLPYCETSSVARYTKEGLPDLRYNSLPVRRYTDKILLKLFLLDGREITLSTYYFPREVIEAVKNLNTFIELCKSVDMELHYRRFLEVTKLISDLECKIKSSQHVVSEYYKEGDQKVRLISGCNSIAYLSAPVTVQKLPGISNEFYLDYIDVINGLLINIRKIEDTIREDRKCVTVLNNKLNEILALYFPPKDVGGQWH